jgi:RNA polymerase sigma-70 factor, ECF subfamily
VVRNAYLARRLRPVIFVNSTPTNINAITEAFARDRTLLLTYIHSQIRALDAAEDILQETWARLWRAMQEGRHVENVSAWCRLTAHHLICDHWRKQARQKLVLEGSLAEVVEQAFAAASTQSEIWAQRELALAECVQALPTQSQKLVHLSYEQGLKSQDVAVQFKQTALAIRKALSRLREALAACIERKLRTWES